MGYTAGIAAALAQGVGQHPLGRQIRKAAVDRLNTEIPEYEQALREWLERYDKCRWAAYSVVSAPVAIHNRGDNRADDITLRITLDDNLTELTQKQNDALPLPPPPKSPEYNEGGLGLDFPMPLPPLSPLALPSFPQATARARNTATGPRFVKAYDRDVAIVRLDTLTHGVTEQSEGRLTLLPRKPGTYDLGWEAHVGNLPRPARGTLRIEVGTLPIEGTPLRTVADVVESHDVPLTGDQ